MCPSTVLCDGVVCFLVGGCVGAFQTKSKIQKFFNHTKEK